MRRLPLLLVLLAGFAVVTRAQQRPLITEDVDIIPPGSIRIEAGIDFMQGAKFPVSGIRGDLTRVGVIGISFGMGPNVEFQIEGVAQNYVSINSRGVSAIPLELLPGANSTNDTGDFTLAATAAGLFAIGTYLVLQRKLSRIIIGLGLLTHGANVLLITAGRRGEPPILVRVQRGAICIDPRTLCAGDADQLCARLAALAPGAR